MISDLARHWWVVALRGVLAFFFGAIAFIRPEIVLEVLVLFYGAYLCTDGVFALSAAVMGYAHGVAWWALTLEGLCGIAAGLVTFFFPGLTVLFVLYLIAIWSIVSGFFAIIAAIRLREHMEGEIWLALNGAFAMLFGMFLVFLPAEGELLIIWILGTYAIILGVMLMAIADRLRHWHRKHELKASTTA